MKNDMKLINPIGNRIKKRRLELKYTVDQVAEMLGKNRATIYRYENGDIDNIPISIVGPLSKILKIHATYLLCIDCDNNDDIELLISKANNLSSEQLKQLLRIVDAL